ncbi:hypothetical protein LINGRAPRIM_LOCUS1549 [Linum grandiflorum]
MWCFTILSRRRRRGLCLVIVRSWLWRLGS